ncbi:hypothetical protein SNARM312S_07964 [Streptomyces narbonensis]
MAVSASARPSRISASRAAFCSSAVRSIRRYKRRPGCWIDVIPSLRPSGVDTRPTTPSGAARAAARRRRPCLRAADRHSCRRASLRTPFFAARACFALRPARTCSRPFSTACAAERSRALRTRSTAVSRPARTFPPSHEEPRLPDDLEPPPLRPEPPLVPLPDRPAGLPFQLIPPLVPLLEGPLGLFFRPVPVPVPGVRGGLGLLSRAGAVPRRVSAIARRFCTSAARRSARVVPFFGAVRAACRRALTCPIRFLELFGVTGEDAPPAVPVCPFEVRDGVVPPLFGVVERRYGAGELAAVVVVGRGVRRGVGILAPARLVVLAVRLRVARRARTAPPTRAAPATASTAPAGPVASAVAATAPMVLLAPVVASGTTGQPPGVCATGRVSCTGCSTATGAGAGGTGGVWVPTTGSVLMSVILATSLGRSGARPSCGGWGPGPVRCAGQRVFLSSEKYRTVALAIDG